jgi:pimeloyl-ACP methyl ester carboxylesterase
VLLMQGLGSTIDEWVAVRRLVAPFARWVEYDRSGLGRSESPPEPPEAISAVSVAADLDTLLKNARIAPPYIIACHSWGGITSREFLHLRPKDVVGMVFVDANTEKTFDGGNWPLPYISAVIGETDWNEATGLTAAQKLSKEEWAAVMKTQQDPRHQLTEAAESRGYQGDPAVLAAKKQFERQVLGDRAISVIRGSTPRDFQRTYDVGVAAGNGTEEERRMFREYLETADEKDHAWQEEILRLSSFGRFVRTSTSGHNVQLVEPDLVAEEIRWVWDHVEE